METINERFRLARKSTGLSQEDFAQKARRTRSEIKNIEYDKTTPKDEVIKSICDAHGINEVWLRTGAGEMYTPRTREEELAAIFANVLISDDAKSRLIRAMARMPDEAFPALQQFVLELAEKLQSEDPQ